MHRQSFLQAIIEAPEDDTPRLVFADWLADEGDLPRAEFIHTQCALARMPSTDPRRPELEVRERELLGQYGWDWAEEVGGDIEEWVFRRGFIEVVQMSLVPPAEGIVEVLNKAPIRHIRDVTQFDDLSGVVGALPHLGRLTGLEFWYLYGVQDELAAEALTSPHLSNLRTLILHHDRNGNLLDESVLVDALRSPYRRALRELAVNVDGTWRGPSVPILMALANSPHLGELRTLHLCNAGDPGHRPGLSPLAIRALAESPNLAHLEELNLAGTEAPAEVWDTLLQMPALSQLRRIWLQNARQVRGNGSHVGYLRDLPAYRTAFEGRVRTVDWDTEFFTPEEAGCWSGLTWEQRQQNHLLAMAPFLRAGDADGLEQEYRARCYHFAGEHVAELITSLPFDRYRERLRPGFELAVAATGPGRAILLRVRPDVDCQGTFSLLERPLDESPLPCAEPWPLPGLLAEFPGCDFSEAAAVCRAHRPKDWVQPNGPLMYAMARTAAALIRLVRNSPTAVPVYFSCQGWCSDCESARLWAPGGRRGAAHAVPRR